MCLPFVLYVNLYHAPALLTNQLLQANTPVVIRPPSSNSAAQVSGEAYQQDGDHIKDIEINDLRNRYTLTKGPIQKRVITTFCCSLIV